MALFFPSRVLWRLAVTAAVAWSTPLDAATDAVSTYVFDVGSVVRKGDDCRFAALPLRLLVALPRNGMDSRTYAVASDGRMLYVEKESQARSRLIAADARDAGLTLLHDQPPRIVGAYRLRALDCTAFLEGSGIVGHIEDGVPTPAQLGIAFEQAENEMAMAAAHRAGNYAKAVALGESTAAALTESLGSDHPATLRVAGAHAWSMSYAGQAAAGLERALRVLDRQREIMGALHPDTRATRHNVTWQLFVAGRTADAIAFGESALADFEQDLGPGHRDPVRLRGRLGTLYVAAGQAQQARDALERTLELQRHVADLDPSEPIAAGNALALAYAALGLAEERLAVQQRVVLQATQVLGPDHPQTLGLRQNLANALTDSGRLVEALALTEDIRAARVGKLGARHPDVATSDKQLGQIYKTLGRFEVALAAVDSAIDIFSGSLGADHPRTLACLNDRAGVLGFLGRTVEALAEQRRAYEAAVRTLGPANLETVKYLSNVAWTALVAGDFPAAVQAAATADQQLAALGPSAGTVRVRNARILALARAASGDVATGRASMESVASHMRSLYGPSHPDALVALAELGDLQLRDSDVTSAKQSLQAVVGRAETLRADIGLTPEQRTGLAQLSFDAYTTLATIHIGQGEDAAAFGVVERGKARRLLDELAQRRADDLGLLTPAEQQRIADEQRRIAWLDESIAGQRDPALRVSQETERNGRYRALTALRAELKAKYPKYAQLAAVHIAEPREVAARLPRRAAFVSYFLSRDRLWAQTITGRGGLASHDLGPYAPIAERIHALRTASLRPWGQAPAGRALAEKLSQDLIEPLRGALADASTWIVVPDADLALLPFELLRWRGREVVATVDLQYVQSASVYLMLAQRHAGYHGDRTRMDLFAVGGARYGGTVPIRDGTPSLRGSTQAALAEPSAKRASAASRGPGELDLAWPELPDSESEVRGVARLFARSRLLLRDEANEARLQVADRTGELAQYRYLLFSTHGYLDMQEPQLSAVVLSQVARTRDADGYVTAAEWLRYQLRSDLTVLSACETALGRNVRGEGVLGLPYALFVAGNVNTLMTLWPVADESTARFVQRFFARLRAGASQVQALAATKREFLRDSKYRAPVYWAAFVLYGV